MNPISLHKYAVLFSLRNPGQAGHLDNTFGHGGISTQQSVIAQLTNVYTVGAVAVQNDGKIVVVGGVPSSSHFTVPAVLRFLSNGSLDKTFAANGIFVLPSSFGSCAAVAIQPDGKTLAGTSAGISAA